MRKPVMILVALVAIVSGLAAGYLFSASPNADGEPAIGGDFTLRGLDGEVSLSDFRGKVVAIYFGYVNCPDACPMTMGKLSAALQKLDDEERDQVRVLLVSLDPERDSARMLANYMAFFGDEFIGVTGTPGEIEAVARAYRVLYQRVEMPNSGLGYTVDHTSNTFIVGRDGAMHTIVAHGSDYTEYRDRLRDAIGAP